MILPHMVDYPQRTLRVVMRTLRLLTTLDCMHTQWQHAVTYCLAAGAVASGIAFTASYGLPGQARALVFLGGVTVLCAIAGAAYRHRDEREPDENDDDDGGDYCGRGPAGGAGGDGCAADPAADDRDPRYVLVHQRLPEPGDGC